MDGFGKARRQSKNAQSWAEVKAEGTLAVVRTEKALQVLPDQNVEDTEFNELVQSIDSKQF